MTGPQLLLYATPGVPFLLTILALIPGFRRPLSLLAIAPLPALAAALLLPDGMVERLPQTLLGAGLAVDELGRLLLGATALLWTFAGIHARATIGKTRPSRFAGFWLATLTGNLLLFLAADVVSFYLAFALLSLAAFGLVVHEGTAEARRAARVYLVLAVFGETCLLLGFLLAVDAADTVALPEVRNAIASAPNRDLAIALLVAGFGLKAGLMPLHVWLPLAHPAAPVPASAVLSGAIVKAGLFGLARFLPLEADLPGWSAVLIILGLATAYCGLLFGLVQQRPKTVLAYSTISQMGLMIAALGSGFGSARPGPVLAAVGLYAAHHALAKGALFLSVGLLAKSGPRSRAPVFVVTALTGLSIAGLPFTGGALAKLAIKGPLAPGAATLLVTMAAVGTTLLMLRFLLLLRRVEPARAESSPALVLPFAGCVATALAVPWLLFPVLTDYTLGHAVNAAGLWGALWPVLTGGAVMAGALRLPRRLKIEIPEGDILVPMEKGWRRLVRGLRGLDRFLDMGLPRLRFPAFVPAAMERSEQALARPGNVGALLLLFALAVMGWGLV